MDLINSIDIIAPIITSFLVFLMTKSFDNKKMAEELKKFEEENFKEDIAKSIEIADIYSKEIMPLIDYIFVANKTNVELSKYTDKINLLRKTKELEFTMRELEETLTKQEIEDIKKLIDPKNLSMEALLTARIPIRSSRLQDIMFINKLKINEGSNEQLKEVFKIQLEDEYIASRGKLLNRLEYISMYFNTGLANEKTVYQSLHQTFIATMVLLYFHIALMNNDHKEKYFTNVISLFNQWNGRYIEKMNLERKGQLDLVECQEKYKKNRA